MRTFDYKKIAEYSWDNEVLSYVAKIHECKGRQELYLKQRPAELERLVEIAKIQSLRASIVIAPASFVRFSFFSTPSS